MSAVNLTNSSCPPASEDSGGEKAIKTLAYALVILIAFLGNVLVISVIYKNKKMRTITNFQIVNMSLADILITVAAMPATIFQIYQGGRWPFGLIPCKLSAFLQGMLASVVFRDFTWVLLTFFVFVRFSCFESKPIAS